MLRKTYYLHSYGCQMNLADSGILSTAMEAAGYQPVPEPEKAGVIILNTCSVREKAEVRALGRLRELSRLKRDQETCLCAIGCMAQRMGDTLIKEIPAIDFILGTERLFELPRLLAQRNGLPVVDTELGADLSWAELPPSSDNAFSVHVTISRGCNNYCAYCIVPYLRGPERHRLPKAIIEDVNHLVEKGVTEVTLVGQNVNSYESGEVSFPDLIQLVIRETDIQRIRFITSHPKDISGELISLFATEPRLMGHVHLALQSGSDRILEKMFRRYNILHFQNRIDQLRQARSDIALTTDLIVGFPTETEEEFEMTLEAVRRIHFDGAYMFRYSVRSGTWAAKNLIDDIPEADKLRRLKKLIASQKEISFEVNQEEIGRVRSVLVDGTSRRDQNVWKGKTEGNKTILFRNDDDLLGQVVPVRVLRADSWTLHGETV